MEEFLAHVDLSILEKLPEKEYIQFKSSVELYMKMTFLPIQSRHDMIMNDVKKYITNVTIVLRNGKIKANKYILSIIPYFDYLFENDHEEFVYIDTTVQCMNIIIDSVYFSTLDTLNINIGNIVEILRLMDMFLYHRYIDQMIRVLECLYSVLITDLLQHENEKDLVLLEMIIYNMMVVNNDARLKKVIEKFKKCTKYMFSFLDWPNIFSSDKQLRKIVETRKFQFFDKSSIEPLLILTTLIHELPYENCYYDAYSSQNVYKSSTINDIDTDNNYFIIKSYYPVFHCFKLSSCEYPRHTTASTASTDELTIILVKSIDLTVGDNILMAYNETIDINDKYEIVGMYKLFEDLRILTTELKFLPNLNYILKFDKPIKDEEFTTWLMKEEIYEL